MQLKNATALLVLFAVLAPTAKSNAVTVTSSHVRIGFYIGNGTSEHADPGFYATLHQAATSSFGQFGFSITNLTEPGTVVGGA